VSSAAAAEPIEVLFGIWTSVGPTNCVLDIGMVPPSEGAILRGISSSIVSVVMQLIFLNFIGRWQK